LRYRHFMAAIDEHDRDFVEAVSWQEGFSNLYFEELPENEIGLHVIVEEGQGLPEFLSFLELIDLGSTEESDWYLKWRETLVPFRLCEGFTVIPLENEALIEERDLIGLIPGMAFGTGLHESTRLAASLLKEVVREGLEVLDVGCGTGILSVLARKAGASKALGLDNDPYAVEKTKETARINCASVDVRLSDFLSSLKGEESFDLIVSNMIAELLENFVGELELHLKDDGYLVLSGIYGDRYSLLAKHTINYTVEKVEEDGDWKAFLLKKR